MTSTEEKSSTGEQAARRAVDLREIPLHLGLGSKATPVAGFAWTAEALGAYEERFAGDGDEGRLVVAFDQEAGAWPTWERHPHGEEVVMLLAGAADLVQWIDGVERVIPLRPYQAAVNPTGVWHTARVHEKGAILTITPGRDTANCPVGEFPPS